MFKDLLKLNKALTKEDRAYYVGLMVVDKEARKLLLGRRREDGFWTGPGGGAPSYENPKQAIIREAFEEANLKIKPRELKELPSQVTRDGKVCHCFLVDVNMNEVQLHSRNDPDKEIGEWKWFDLDAPLPYKIDAGRFSTINNAKMRLFGLRKSILENPEAGIDLNTAENSMDVSASTKADLNWANVIVETMRGSDYGSAPRELMLSPLLKLYLSKVDDGIYSGILKKEDPEAGDNGEVQTQLMKMTPESMVQALKAKGYLPREADPEPAKTTAPKPAQDYKGLFNALKRFQGELHIHLAKSEDDKLQELNEALTKGKAFPVGTMRIWAGQKYVKHSDGWVAVSGDHHGKLMGKFKEQSTHHDYANLHHEKTGEEEPAKPNEPGSLGEMMDNVAEGLYATPKATEEAKEKQKPKKKEKKPEPKVEETESSEDSPRDLAEAETEEMAETEYANDRESKVEQRGEDVLGSARHKALVWKSLKEALSSKDAEAMFTRDFLLSQEPIDFHTDLKAENASVRIFAYSAIRKFGAFSPRGVMNDPDNLRKEREAYYEAYKSVKSIIEESLKGGPQDPDEFRKNLGKKVLEKYREVTAGGNYSAGAEALRQMYNKSTKRSSTSPYGIMNDYRTRASQMPADKSNEYVAAAEKILSGKSVNAAFGTVKKKERGLNIADFYDTDKMVRKGPPSKYKGVKQGLDLLDKNAGGPFEIRGVQWGKSVTDEEREHHLKSLVDSFSDLTDILGLPAEMASFNGRLAIAVGARGKGGALAHYEPNQKILNLTRSGGAGSLAHEWGHFFDNILAKVSTDGRADDGRFATDSAGRYSGGDSDIPAIQEIKNMYKSEVWNKMDQRIRAVVRKNGEDAGYWNSNIEMWARAFERHVQHKLHSQGRENTYLVAVRKQGESEDNLWPTDSEISQLSPMFDKIFDAFKKSNLLKKALILLEQERLKVSSGSC